MKLWFPLYSRLPPPATHFSRTTRICYGDPFCLILLEFETSFLANGHALGTRRS